MRAGGYRSRGTGQGVNRRRFLGAGLTLTGTAAFLAACGGKKEEAKAPAAAPGATTQVAAATAAPTPEITRGGVLRGVGPQVYDSVDPHRAFGDPTSWLLNQVQSKLVWYKNPDTGEIEPDVAQSYEALDAATYVFRLRQGVKWHNKPPANGREFVADDVRWHIERQATQKLADGSESPMRHSAFYKTITKIETPDKYTVRLTLSEPNGTFLDRLAAYFSTIPNREAMEKFEKDHRTLHEDAAIGTGPYILVEWRAGKNVVMKRNPDYFRKDVPITDGQIWTILFEDPNAQRAAFEQKQLDSWSAPDPSVTQAVIKANPGVMYEVLSGVANTVFLHLNMNQQFKDVRLVKALNMAFDRRQAIQVFHLGLGQVSGPVTWLQEGFAIPGADLVKLPGYRTDREAEKREARQLWQAGGGPALGEVDIKIPRTWLARWPDTPQIIPRMLNEALGVTQFKSTPTDYNEEIIPNLANGKFPNWFGWTSQVNSPDPRNDLYNNFHTKGSTNFQKVSNPELDRLLEEARQTVDQKKAVQVVRRIQEILLENGQYGNVVLYNYISPTARWNYLRGLLKEEPAPGKSATGYNIYVGHRTATDLWINTKDPTYQGRPPATVN